MEGALELWRDYNGRACVEQRIKELKHDLAADGFCLQPFFATEGAFLAVLFTFNLLSLYQHQTTPEAAYRQPGALRVAACLCGALLGVLGRDVVIKLSAAWGGMRKTQTAGAGPCWTGANARRRSWCRPKIVWPSEAG
jgi:hypothetical protein